MPMIGATPDPNLPPPALLVIDLGTGAVETRERGPRPLGWLGDRRLLAHTGREGDQDKVLSILEL